MKVTIAIPFYNAERYLAQAIESVLAQTYSHFVLLLVDDGSTDQSLQIAKEYAEKDSRIKVFSNGQNKNLGYRLNQITTLVSTKYLARMDADDIMHPKRIERQIEILEQHPEIDVLGTNAYSIDENNNIIGLRMARMANLINTSSFVHPSIMAKTQWFLEHPYDVKAERIEDAELWLSTYHNNCFKNTTEPLLFYREIGNNYWKKYFKGNKAVIYVLKKHRFSKDFVKFAIRYYIAGVVYFIFNLFNKESVLIKNRNKVLLKDKTINDILKDE